MNDNLVLIFSFWLITFLFWFFITPYYIELLKKYKLWKQIREEALSGKASEFFKLHKNKTWTPTMGWWVIIITVFFMVFLSIVIQQLGFSNNSLLNQRETYLSLFTLFTVWILWTIDDYMNIRGIGRTKWLSARFKMMWLLIFAAMWAFWFYFKLDWNAVNSAWEFIKWINNPFWESWKIGSLFIPLFILVIVSGANSVNITDGLDWLAGWLLMFCYWIYTFICYQQELFLLSTLCFSIFGALMAFLWYNVRPAKFFMGDVWSLALWANLWIIAMLTNTLFILVIIWGVFILETLSVIIQLTSKKFRNGKKVFKIAPFHHHLEACGWPEENVVFRLWLIGLILSISGFMFYIFQA